MDALWVLVVVVRASAGITIRLEVSSVARHCPPGGIE
jgi:hypothetical protein